MGNFDRSRQQKWDNEHLKTVSTHLRVEEWNALKVVCRKMKISRYRLMQGFLRAYIARHADLLYPPVIR